MQVCMLLQFERHVLVGKFWLHVLGTLKKLCHILSILPECPMLAKYPSQLYLIWNTLQPVKGSFMKVLTFHFGIEKKGKAEYLIEIEISNCYFGTHCECTSKDHLVSIFVLEDLVWLYMTDTHLNIYINLRGRMYAKDFNVWKQCSKGCIMKIGDSFREKKKEWVFVRISSKFLCLHLKGKGTRRYLRMDKTHSLSSMIQSQTKFGPLLISAWIWFRSLAGFDTYRLRNWWQTFLHKDFHLLRDNRDKISVLLMDWIAISKHCPDCRC